GLRIVHLLARTDVRVVHYVQPFTKGRHHPVLDAVVDHLHEVARPVRAAVQPALFGRAGRTGPARRALRGAHARGDRGEHRGHTGHRVVVAADHHAVAAVQAPDPAAGPAVDQADALLGQLGRAGDVVAVVGVAAVDDDVARLHALGQLIDRVPGDLARGHHHPGRPRLVERGDEVVQGRRAGRALAGQLLDRSRAPVVDHARMAAAHEPAHQV